MVKVPEEKRQRTRFSRSVLHDNRLRELLMVEDASDAFLADLGQERVTKKYTTGREDVYAKGSYHAGPEDKIAALCKAHACCKLVPE